MKQVVYKLGLLCSLGTAVLSYAQKGRVGINTEKPKASLHILEKRITNENRASAQGVIFPHITTAQRNDFQNVEKGTMIFNTDKQCLEIYAGTTGQWYCVHQGPSSNSGSTGGSNTDGYNPEIAGIIVQKIAYAGNYTSGVELNDNNIVTIKLYNPKSTAYTNIDLSNALTLINGIDNIRVKPGQNTSVSIPPRQSVEIRYTLTGIPISNNPIQYLWNMRDDGVYSIKDVEENPSDKIIRYLVSNSNGKEIGYGFATRDFNTHCNRLKALYPNRNIMIGIGRDSFILQLEEILHVCH